MRLKVEGDRSFSRETSTNAIINTNKSDYERYLQQRQRLNNQELQTKEYQQKLDLVMSEVDELKSMMYKLLQKLEEKA